LKEQNVHVIAEAMANKISAKNTGECQIEKNAGWFPTGRNPS
jgi:hypothetical protein